VCLSPKAGAEVVLERADEVKLVFPQVEPEAAPERWIDFPATVHSLQPMDGPERAATTSAAVAYCLEHPEWRLSVQTHKDLGIP
jgi:7-carboxy-7-deazaguanine synthase